MTIAQYRGHFIFLSVTLLLVLFHFGLYSSGRPLRLRQVYAIVLTSGVVWLLGNVALSFELTTQPIVSRIYLFCAFICTLATLMLWHRLFALFLSIEPIAAMLQRRILFVGWSDQSQRLLENIEADPKHPYQVVGCVPPVSGRFDRDPTGRVETLGEYGEVRGLLAEHAIDLVMVADFNPTRGALLELVNTCEKEMVHLQIIPSCFQVLLSGLHLETTSGVPVLGISRLPLDSPWNQMLKRGIDLVGSLIGLALSGPIIALFGALVYLESPGPIFYRQTRLGRDGKRFHIIKIRSMKLNAEAGGVVGWSRPGDPRRLRIGSLMRSLNIDEVPQFWNVLKGRDEPRRAAPRTARTDREVQGTDSPLQRAPRHQAGHHGLGAGQRVPRGHGPHRADQVRPVLRGELEPADGIPDSADDLFHAHQCLLKNGPSAGWSGGGGPGGAADALLALHPSGFSETNRARPRRAASLETRPALLHRTTP